MELRYLGFDQKENSRVYRFDVQTDGQPMKEVSVTADLVVFRDHRVGIQEGPFPFRQQVNHRPGTRLGGRPQIDRRRCPPTPMPKRKPTPNAPAHARRRAGGPEYRRA